MTNTKNTLIAQRYADAIVEIAKDGKLSYSKISTDLALIDSILSQSKDLKEFLENPLISVEDKKEIIQKVFSDEIDNLIANFLMILIEKNRFNVFNDILIAYNKSIDDINNISRVSVTSAVEMTEDAKAKLKNKLETKMHKSISFDWEINPDIIAGLVIKMGDNVIDMSMKNKLEALSKSITR